MSWVLRAPAVATLGVVLMLGSAGCDEPASLVNCSVVVEALYSNGQSVAGEDGAGLDSEDALALCSELKAEVGCEAAFERWFGCLQGGQSAVDPLCPRELLAAVACRDGQPYEYHCADAGDGDEDGAVDCADPDCLDSRWCALAGDVVPLAADPAVDVLFVVDFHDSMAEERTALGAAMSYLLDRLRDDDGALPDLHLGFVSSDLGVGGEAVPGCTEPAAGEAGLLDAGGCTGMGGANYLVDVAPRGCSVTRDSTFGRCTAHDCVAADCDHEPQANLVEDENDCPRCRNFGLLPEDLYDCVAGHALTSCPFRQPLEAARLALDSHPGNADFLRERAHLAVVVVSNTDDCSASGAGLFDPDPTTLGPPTAFRCFDQGVACNESGTNPGPRTGCAPVDDTNGLLHPISRYVEFLSDTKHPFMLTVAAASGPVVEDSAEVTTDASGNPALASSCAAGPEYATPALRLRAWSSYFNDLDSAFWPYSPICGELGAALQGVGDTVATALAHRCPAAPLAGCSDPGATAGQPWDDETCNDACEPRCWVVEATDAGLPGETRTWLPHCRQVCPGGLCLDNTDPAEAYAGGHPSERDPALPVAACWHVVADPLCADARGANVAIARQQDPPLRTFAYVDCALLGVTETDCADGMDDDGDCLVDLDDPDCGR